LSLQQRPYASLHSSRRLPPLRFLFASFMHLSPLCSTLFPYTTLFRSGASYDTLKKRGYEVYVLNLIQQQMGMGFNPLQMVIDARSEEHTSELQSRFDLVCRLLLE